jgi:hypothetical protein
MNNEVWARGASLVSGERVGKVLERTARAFVRPDSNTNQAAYDILRGILEERLGPLLRAGQAMQSQLSAILGVDDRAVTNGDTLKILDEWQDRSEFIRGVLEAWDAALAALEREK